MRRIDDGFDGLEAVFLLALGDIALGEIEIIEDRRGIGPLLEEIVVLEEVIVTEARMRHH